MTRVINLLFLGLSIVANCGGCSRIPPPDEPDTQLELAIVDYIADASSMDDATYSKAMETIINSGILANVTSTNAAIRSDAAWTVDVAQTVDRYINSYTPLERQLNHLIKSGLDHNNMIKNLLAALVKDRTSNWHRDGASIKRPYNEVLIDKLSDQLVRTDKPVEQETWRGVVSAMLDYAARDKPR